VVHRMAGLDSHPLVGDTAAVVVHHTQAVVVVLLHMAVAEEDNLVEEDSLAEEDSPAEADNLAEEDSPAEGEVHRTVAVPRGSAVLEVAHNLHMAAGREEERRRQVVAEDTGWAAHRMLAVEEDNLLQGEHMAVARMAVAGNLYSSARHVQHGERFGSQLTSWRRSSVLVWRLVCHYGRGLSWVSG
jgi:hypothetical protein